MPTPFHPADWQQQQQLAEFDRLLTLLRAWVDGLPAWQPADRVRALWTRIEPRLGELQVNLDRVLVLGLVGGTGSGKSTLVNALIGRRVTLASDAQRPTTTRPVVLYHPNVDPSFLEIDNDRPELHALPNALLENMILIDCPDPDTQASAANNKTPASRNSTDDNGNTPNRTTSHTDARHNRDLLRRILPHCDVIVHVGTAQKYKTQAVVDELLAHAPGRQIVFVQTHAATDADIRPDSREHLQSIGFDVPQLFRVDSERALSQQEQGLRPGGDFLELVDFIASETAARGRHCIHRANVLDLIDWFLNSSREYCDPSLAEIDKLTQQVQHERERLFGQVRNRLEQQLRDNRQLWRVRLLRQVTQRWGWGPFAAFVRLTSSASSLVRLLPFMRARSLAPMLVTGGLAAGKAVVDSVRESMQGSEWIAAADLGVSQADLVESQSVLTGQAHRAGLDVRQTSAASSTTRMAGTTSVSMGISAEGLSQLARQLHDRIELGIEQTSAQRAHNKAGAAFHLLLEILFTALPGFLLFRLGYNFFYEHNWLGLDKPIYGIEYLIQAALWIVVWGLLLRAWLINRLQSGLQREINKLVTDFSPATALGPLFGEMSEQADAVRSSMEVLNSIEQQTKALREQLLGDESSWKLGRLREGPRRTPTDAHKD